MTEAGTAPSVTLIAVSIIDRVKPLMPKPYWPRLRRSVSSSSAESASGSA